MGSRLRVPSTRCFCITKGQHVLYCPMTDAGVVVYSIDFGYRFRPFFAQDLRTRIQGFRKFKKVHELRIRKGPFLECVSNFRTKKETENWGYFIRHSLIGVLFENFYPAAMQQLCSMIRVSFENFYAVSDGFV